MTRGDAALWSGRAGSNTAEPGAGAGCRSRASSPLLGTAGLPLPPAAPSVSPSSSPSPRPGFPDAFQAYQDFLGSCKLSPLAFRVMELPDHGLPQFLVNTTACGCSDLLQKQHTTPSHLKPKETFWRKKLNKMPASK